MDDRAEPLRRSDRLKAGHADPTLLDYEDLADKLTAARGMMARSRTIARRGTLPGDAEAAPGQPAVQRKRGREAEPTTSELPVVEQSVEAIEARHLLLDATMLAKQGDHEGALALWERIIESGDARMARKAEQGRCAALRALGRDTEAEEAGCDE